LTTTGRRQRNRSLTRVVATLALAVIAAMGAGPATAAKSCGEKVIDDWYADGRVDGAYDLSCYDDAIEALPRDVKDYSSAKEDIERAMQLRMRDGDSPPGTDGDLGNGGPTDTTDPDETDTNGPGLKPGDAGEDDAGQDTEVVPSVDTTSSSDSIPVPLLVLAGLALLLVAAGSVGYLVRRLQARRVPPASL